MRIYFTITIALISYSVISAQNNDSVVISTIYKNALSSTESYKNLEVLCKSAKGRMVGTEEADNAVEILKNQVDQLMVDTIYKQDYYTSSWKIKKESQAIAYYSDKQDTLNIATLGMSVSTPENGINGELLEVYSLNSLDTLGYKSVKDKIVFFNRPMDNSIINTMDSYVGAIRPRIFGAIKAAENGAKGVIVRSLATQLDNFPHTGVSNYKEGVNKIPMLSISTNDAERLSQLNKKYPQIEISLKCNTETLDSIKTSNLIAELRGTKYPDKIILIGAHIDAWYNTEGAHDDGAGCVQMIDVLRIFSELKLKTNHTIRLVLFMDEEINQSGAEKYAKKVGQENKEHIVAIESDGGGFLPLGFTIDADDSIIDILREQTDKLLDYGCYKTIKGFGGVDIKPLAKYNVPLVGLLTNTQRYFEYHHSENDTFEKVSRRELQLGTAMIASFVYLIDKYGIE